MPVYRDGIDKADRYDWPAKYVTAVKGIDVSLRQWRKQAIKDQELFTGYQKICGREDREYARFFSDCVKEALRIQRACTLMLPWVGDPDKGQKEQRPSLWPVDLATELDLISGRIILQYS